MSPRAVKVLSYAGLMVAGLVVLPIQGQAQQSTAPSGTAEVIKTYDAQTMRPEDIRKCLERGEKLNQQEKAKDDYSLTVQQYLGKITKLGEGLKRQRLEIDNTDPDAVKKYNDRIQEHASMIDRYNTRMVPQLVSRQEQLAKDVARYNKQCSGKKYFEDDWVAAVKELGIADPRSAAAQ